MVVSGCCGCPYFYTDMQYSDILTYYNNLAARFRDAQGDYGQFYETLCKGLKTVVCVPLHTVIAPEIYKDVRRHIRPQRKMCYRNASKLIERLHDAGIAASYVEGAFVRPPIPFPFEHAFVKIGNAYVDPTAEFALKASVAECSYASWCEVSFWEMLRVQLKTGVYGNVFRTRFIENLEKVKKNLG